MVLSTPVPTETIHAIIHELIGDNLSLRNTSLVARSFLRLSQQLLFSKIILTLNAQDKDVNVARAQRLLSIFSSNPGLALHPREFCLTMNKKWKATHALPQMLAKLTRIQVATLNLETDWETMDLSTQNAISDLCGVHSLIDLTLTSVFGFPAEIFAGVSQLKRLNLREMEFRMSDANHEIPELGISGSRTRGQLEVLEFDNDTACRDTVATLFEALKHPQSRLGIEELRALKINGDGEYTRDSIREVIKFAAESLECFVWDTLDGASEDNDPYYYSLESRESFQLFLSSKISRVHPSTIARRRTYQHRMHDQCPLPRSVVSTHRGGYRQYHLDFIRFREDASEQLLRRTYSYPLP